MGNPSNPKVIWITGLSGAGKSTVASDLVHMLKADARQVVLLDGDELRAAFGATNSNRECYGREGRLTLAMQYSHLCKLLVNQGITVVIATISLFHEVHAWNRANLPGYFEVYIKVPIEELRRRDPKGIYKSFDIGDLTHIAGLDLTIEEPLHPDLLLEYSPSLDAKSSAEKIFASFTKTGSAKF